MSDIKHSYSLEELFIMLDNCNEDIMVVQAKQKKIIDLIYQKTKEKAPVGAEAN